VDVAGRRADVLDIREMLRRFQAGDGDRRIARDLSASRKTVSKYRAWATAEGLTTGPLPEPGVLQARLAATFPTVPPPQIASKVAAHAARVLALRARGVECQAIYARLCEEVGFTGSYASVYRFVRRQEPREPEACVRVETPAGEVAQVDFGAAGRLRDPRTGRDRKAWMFVMTLAYSRHCYVEFVFDETVSTWLQCHRHAFEWFGGVVRRVVVDNLKAAITHATLYDPVVQRAYRECAEHYGFLISPCRPQMPEHKGKVESGVHYAARNFLAGREFADVVDANRRVRVWCRETAGQRVHGTTKEAPLLRFEAQERAVLLPLPPTPYALTTWKQAKLHRDGHVIFDGAFYSAPHRFIGAQLWIRAAETTVTIFHGYDLVGVHPRATGPGMRATVIDHLPPAKVEGLLTTPALCLRRAADIGPATATLIGRVLGERPLDRLRTASGILRLAHKYAPRRLDAACARALAFEDLGYATIKRILVQGLDLTARPPDAPTTLEPPPQFARPWTDFFGEIGGDHVQ
jgi:transposase